MAVSKELGVPCRKRLHNGQLQAGGGTQKPMSESSRGPAGQVGDGLTIHGLGHTCGTLMKELGFDLDTIADMLGQETAGMAAWYAPDAQLERKLAGVVEAIDEQLSNNCLTLRLQITSSWLASAIFRHVLASYQTYFNP
jgi:hypothetical protein